MRAILDLLKNLLIGGFLFLLPLGIILIVFGKLLSVARGWGRALHQALFPGAPSSSLVLLFAILILVAAALIAGLLARTRMGKRTFAWFEEVLLSRLPFYAIIRQLIPEADSAGLGRYPKTPVVTARLDDQTLVGLLVETTPEGKKVVYLPGAPSALSGTVAIMDPDRVTETGVNPQDFLSGLRRLGAGLAQLTARAP